KKNPIEFKGLGRKVYGIELKERAKEERRNGESVESLLWRKSLYTVFANLREGDIVEKKSEGSEADGSQGPPVLTILAGFMVLFLIFWIVGSIVMWLVGLIVNVPLPK
ncbi:hypothetical protein FRX31_012963, partial [Thalictrum thalictroides]